MSPASPGPAPGAGWGPQHFARCWQQQTQSTVQLHHTPVWSDSFICIYQYARRASGQHWSTCVTPSDAPLEPSVPSSVTVEVSGTPARRSNVLPVGSPPPVLHVYFVRGNWVPKHSSDATGVTQGRVSLLTTHPVPWATLSWQLCPNGPWKFHLSKPRLLGKTFACCFLQRTESQLALSNPQHVTTPG